MDISNNDVTSTPVATGSRRKSGRAVKVPEKFVPETAPASVKRKRGDEENENDASDVDEEAEASDATAASGEEEEPRPSRKKGKGKAPRKPAAKKPKVNGAAAHEEEDEEVAPAVKLPSRPKAASRRVAIADKNAEGLYGKRVRAF
jgi:cohesin complex subunit SA-1/2